jgi:hypothetical protein
VKFREWVSTLHLCVDGNRIESYVRQNFLLLAVVNVLKSVVGFIIVININILFWGIA